MRTAIVLVLLWAGPAALRAAEEGPDLFTTQVRPILSRHCFACHGPDAKARKAGLRLDVRDGALRLAGSGLAAIVPGKPEESELVQRINAEDPEERMPPPGVKNPLTDAEKQVLNRWIAEGAEYKQHWSFVPPRQAALPAVRHQEWPRNPIDAFVLSRLEASGLQPSPPVDRLTLIRRVALDLTGLPPSPEEAAAFLNDPNPDAYETVVDRLLASPHYGERWARRWLDLARYADTNGYEKDRARPIWPYRDWVIDALNADQPFDQFTRDQIAGDMLPGATRAQRVATGFHRNTMLNEEGGIDPLEFRFYAMVDRVGTTGTVWLGLTVMCAQCHTHKYDPIPQREFYQLMAFLNNADEPELPLPTAESAARRRALDEKTAALIDTLPSKFPLDDKDKNDPRPLEERRRENLERRFREWLEQESRRTVRWTVLKPTEARANLPHLTVEADGSVVALGDQSKSDTYTLKLSSDLRGITALRLDVLPDDRLPRRGPGRVFYEGPFGDFFLSELTVTAGGTKRPLKEPSHSFAKDKNSAAAAIDGDQQTGWSIDGGQGRPHSAVFLLASPLDDARDFEVRMLFERYYAAGLGRFRLAVTTDPRPAVAREMSEDDEALLLIPEAERTAAQTNRLLRHFLMAAPELAKERAAIEALRKELPADPITLVMAERPLDGPRPTFLHKRGEFLQPAERVEPGVLSCLTPLPSDAPRNRLGLARWLTDPNNPLVGRVTMNRAWAAFFGRGLVRTTQDFGFQGEPPSHPALLDWLAVEFVKQGWSQKAMHKLIVMSATYRQASRTTPELLAKDPANILLSRGPRVRLEAETIRDTILSVSGLLSAKVGGPSVFPPQPPGVSTEGTYGALPWTVSAGPDRYRRGLYTFSKRTAPYAMFTTFDGPSGEVCVARRDVSNTPLQALTMLNDPVFTEAAQALGRALAKQPGTTAERVESLFRRCLTRAPDPDELSLLVRFFEARQQRFATRPADAATFAGPGEGDPGERAAWTALARALFNLDEMIMKE